jgi:adenylate cyclase
MLPSPPRCKLCFAPYAGVGKLVMALQGRAPSNRNPRFCSLCDKFIRANPGGAEVELSMTFVDVRESTALAEKLGPTAFSHAMNRFYVSATGVLNEADGFIIDLVGDEVVALYPPGFSGTDHARKAINAAHALTRLEIDAGAGTKLSLGVGVHTGTVFIGTVNGAQSGIEDVRALGVNVNATARLASSAAPGEALVSLAAWTASGLDAKGREKRSVAIKGMGAPMDVGVLRAGDAALA